MIRSGSPPVCVSMVVILWQEEGGCQLKFVGKMLGKGSREFTPLFEGIESLPSVMFGLAILISGEKRRDFWRVEIRISRKVEVGEVPEIEYPAGAPFDQHAACPASHSLPGLWSLTYRLACAALQL